MSRRPRDVALCEEIGRILDVSGMVVTVQDKPDMSPATLDETNWASVVRSYLPMLGLGDISQPRLVVMPLSIQQDVLTRADDTEVIQVLLAAMQKMEVDDRTKQHREIADRLDLLVEQSLQLLMCNHLIDFCGEYGGAYLATWRRDVAFEQEMAQDTHAIVMNSLLNYGAIYDRCNCCVIS